jgi:hypothetical protein
MYQGFLKVGKIRLQIPRGRVVDDPGLVHEKQLVALLAFIQIRG